MKYYRLFKYENTPVGGIFIHCTEDELENTEKEFKPDKIDVISKDVYNEGKEREHRRNYRLATGYPKR